MKPILTILLIAFYTLSFGQNDSIILAAMKDEMNRSMNELKSDELDPPFYISYSFYDSESRTTSATMGAFGGLNVNPVRKTGVRVMIGDYDLNDESFDSDTRIDGSFENEMVPLEDDYWALRRSFWHATDNIYRRASKIYKEHQKFIEKSKTPLDSLPHRWYAKADPVIYHQESNFEKPTAEEMKSKVMTLSEYFIPHRNLKNSYVSLSDTKSTSYEVNTEGSEVVFTSYKLTLILKADIMLESGQVLGDQLTIYGQKMSDLPSNEALKANLEDMIAKLESREENTVELEEDYKGPVLYLDQSATSVFNNSIANTYKSSYISAPNKEKKGSTYNSNVKKMEEKIGEKILPEDVSIILRPTLKEYDGQKLLGCYEVDDECLRAPDELVLVENGVLKNIMISRTLTKKEHAPTGTASGAVVVEVRFNDGIEEAKMKKELIKLAKKAKLDYAVVVRRRTDNNRTTDLYKVNLKDGSEELIKNATLSYSSVSDLENIAAVSNTYMVNNVYGYGTSGATSVIAPTAVLLKERSVNKSRYTYNPEKPKVPSPLLE